MRKRKGISLVNADGVFNGKSEGCELDMVKIRAELGEQARAIGLLRDTLFDFFDDRGEIAEFEKGLLGVLVSLKNSLEYASDSPELKDLHHDMLEQAFALAFVRTAFLGEFGGGRLDETIEGVIGALGSLMYSLRHTAHRLDALA